MEDYEQIDEGGVSAWWGFDICHIENPGWPEWLVRAETGTENPEEILRMNYEAIA